MKLADFHYHLPPEQIAHSPVQPRDSSRLLVVHRAPSNLQHAHYQDLPELLQSGDVLVRNNTKVIPARIYGQKPSGADVEILLTKRLKTTNQGEVWECLSKPGLKPGQAVQFEGSILTAHCVEITGYTRQVEFNQQGSQLFTTLFEIGHTPLPPYIQWQGDDETALRQHYQTTYAKVQGSSAAPTAGLHFTPELDQRLRDKGIEILEITLHVGLGTFLRVKVDDVTKHHMHSEVFELLPDVANKINVAKRANRRIIAVGTTTTRVLESCSDSTGHLAPRSGETDIYIYPPYTYKVLDGLITNFHEPQSTLLMLVSAFVSAPNTAETFTSFSNTAVGKAYQTALEHEYRFLSFGDGMLIL